MEGIALVVNRYRYHHIKKEVIFFFFFCSLVTKKKEKEAKVIKLAWYGAKKKRERKW